MSKDVKKVRGVKKVKKTFSEFKEFISRGSVVDMAVGIIIGSAFTAIVTSLVNDVIMPLTSIITGGINFKNFKFVLKPAEGEVLEVAINYGNFIQKVVDFLIVALVVFVLIRQLNKLRKAMDEFNKKEEKIEKVPEIKSETEVEILSDIRELLKTTSVEK